MALLNRSKTSKVKAETLLDGLTSAVICVDQQLNIAGLNLAAETLFGVGRKHALQEPLVQVIPHFQPHLERISQAISRFAGFIERETRLSHSGHAPLTVDWTVTPFQDGKLRGVLMELLPLDRHLRISRDEMLSAQHQASRAMIRGLAHEIKNPLGGIRGAAQLLEREFPDSEHREYTQVIIKEADRLQNLVNRMLGPNRLPQKATLNIHEVLEHVRQLAQAEGQKGVTLLRDYDPSIPDVFADREQLIQAVLNVVRNALQALEGTVGTVLLRTRTRRQFTLAGHRHKLVAQIDVEDSGVGIAPEMMEKIFYPMVTTRPEGTGLGLPIAQVLVHSHGGVIECMSRAGQTIFSIYLPFVQLDETAKGSV
ncbi:MAG: nitrogen regulation protein NR(II) [Pseudomonadota bacterium]